MKTKRSKIIVVTLIVALLLGVSIYLVDIFVGNSDIEKPVNNTTVENAENNEAKDPQNTDKVEQLESATPLTEDEIKELFMNAHKLYVDWTSPAAKYLNVDWEKTTEIKGVEYFEVVSDEITTVDQLIKEYEKYFSDEIIEESADRYYVMRNDKMYGNAVLVEGGEVPSDNHKLTIKTNTSTECVFTIASGLNKDNPEWEYTLHVIDGEWKFTGAFNWVTMDEDFKVE